MIDYSDAEVIWMKVERILLCFANIVLLIMACRNVWVFLIQKRMYKSYPLCFTYCLIIFIELVEIVYNFYMAVWCGQHDCSVRMILEPGKPISHYETVHYPTIRKIALMWKLRQ